LFSTALVSTLIGCAFSASAAAEQQVATGSNFPNALITTDAITNEIVSRVAVIIGADTTALNFVYENNYISPTTVTNTGNAVSILGACLESDILHTFVPTAA
jgi:hypothetical protein